MDPGKCIDEISALFDRENNERMQTAAYTLCKKVNEFNPTVHVNASAYFDSFCCGGKEINEICQKLTDTLDDVQLTCTLNKFSFLDYDAYTNAMLAFCLPVGLLANILMIYLITRHKCLPKPTGYFLCSLAFGDIGCIFQTCAYVGYERYNFSMGKQLDAYLFPSLTPLFAAINLLQISVLSVERAMAVTKPAVYRRYITTNRARLLTAGVWVISFMIFTLFMLRIPIHEQWYANFTFYFSVLTMLVVPIIVVLVSYTVVAVTGFLHLNNDREKCRNHAVSFVLQAGRRRSSFSISLLRLKQMQMSMNLAVLTAPFLGCWGLIAFIHAYEILTQNQFEGVANWFFIVLPLFVSSTNPLVYIGITKELRKSALSIVCRNNEQESDEDTSMEGSPDMQYLRPRRRSAISITTESTYKGLLSHV